MPIVTIQQFPVILRKSENWQSVLLTRSAMCMVPIR